MSITATLILLISSYLHTKSVLSFSITTTTSQYRHEASQSLPVVINSNINNINIIQLYSSFASDGSEYSNDSNNNNNDMDEEEIAAMKNSMGNNINNGDGSDDDTPTIELSPVPMSKNSGNRFVTIIFDQQIRKQQFNEYNNNNNNNNKNKKNNNKNNNNNNPYDKDVIDLHYDRIALTEDHVMYCRKANLYNDTFNTNSMVDVMWSLPILSSDLHRVIGHAMCLESTNIEYVHSFLQNEPIIRMLLEDNTNDDSTSSGTTEIVDNNEKYINDYYKYIPLYRWRHIRDYSLRIDDGRFGYPCMAIAMDEQQQQEQQQQIDIDIDDESSTIIRNEYNETQLEYLIRSERVIAVGPLHIATPTKDDTNSIAIGDLILFNAKDRIDGIHFIENLPYSQYGLYNKLHVHFYNQLDISGKFVSEDPLRDSPCEDMKEAMDVWGYPVHDEQTTWLNC